MFRALFLCLVAASAGAQDAPRPAAISVLAFGDYYAVASHHLPDVEDRHGFWIRRALLTLDRSFGEQFDGRLRFEANQPGDFTTNATLDPFVKDAWLRWKTSPRAELIIGLSPTPTCETIEEVWGYRIVEKTPVDLQRIAPTRDIGIAVRGALTAGNRVQYHLMYGNGAGTGSETNEGKQLALAVDVAPTPSTVVQVYGDYDDRTDGDRSLLQLFAGLRGDRLRAGLQYSYQSREGGDDLDLASLFAVYALRPDVRLLARVDRMFDPNPEGDRVAYIRFDPAAESTLLIAGVDWRVHPNVNVIPNVEWVTYEDGGEDDVLARITLAFRF